MNRLGRAMADPTRARILMSLLEKPGYPAVLARDLDLTRSNVSNHLTCLRRCGIVATAPEDRQTRYEIADPRLTRALGSLVDVVLVVDDGTTSGPPRILGPIRARVLQRRIRIIVTITITYNVIEATTALAAGTVASSAALIGFGFDSIVEVLSAAAIAWQFAVPDPQGREKVALRGIAFSFFGLAACVIADAALSLLGFRAAEHSPVCIALAAVSLAIMPFLSWFERRTGRELGSASAIADSRQTLLCSYLSAALLVDLLLNSLLGWAWADSAAALFIAGFAIREGLEAWNGNTCAVPVSALTGERKAVACGCC